MVAPKQLLTVRFDRTVRYAGVHPQGAPLRLGVKDAQPARLHSFAPAEAATRRARISPRSFTHGYGVRWDGLSSYWKGVAGMGSVSSPPGASVSRTVFQYMHWRIKSVLIPPHVLQLPHSRRGWAHHWRASAGSSQYLPCS